MFACYIILEHLLLQISINYCRMNIIVRSKNLIFRRNIKNQLKSICTINKLNAAKLITALFKHLFQAEIYFNLLNLFFFFN